MSQPTDAKYGPFCSECGAILPRHYNTCTSQPAPPPAPQPEPSATVCPRCDGTGGYSYLGEPTHSCGVCSGTGKITPAAPSPARRQPKNPTDDPYALDYFWEWAEKNGIDGAHRVGDKRVDEIAVAYADSRRAHLRAETMREVWRKWNDTFPDNAGFPAWLRNQLGKK